MSIEKTSKSAIPDWLLEKNGSDISLNGKKNKSFLTNTFKNISAVFQNEFFCERYAGNGKFLQSIDARVKFLMLLFYMIYSNITRNILTLLFLTVISIMFAKLSGLNLKMFIKRVWMYLPVIVFILSIPAASSLFIKGTPLFYIYQADTSELYFSINGIVAIIKMALRIGVALSFGYLLIATTRWSSLTKSFSVLKIPMLVISIINMTYRYIFVLSNIAMDMIEARFIRTVGTTDNKSNRSFISHSFAYLFVKSSYLSEEIYDAMRCRGFTGKPVALESFKLTSIDLLFIINNIVIVFIMILGERLF